MARESSASFFRMLSAHHPTQSFLIGLIVCSSLIIIPTLMCAFTSHDEQEPRSVVVHAHEQSQTIGSPVSKHGKHIASKHTNVSVNQATPKSEKHITLLEIIGRYPKAIAVLIVSVGGSFGCLGGLFYCYFEACHRLASFPRVKGRIIQALLAKSGYCLEYVYVYKGKTYYSNLGACGKLAGQLLDITVLVDPENPQKSSIKELLC